MMRRFLRIGPIELLGLLDLRYDGYSCIFLPGFLIQRLVELAEKLILVCAVYAARDLLAIFG